MVSVTICPPMPAHKLLPQEIKIARRLHSPVSPETRIAFSDYDRMGTFEHKIATGRRTEVPNWALNDEQLRLVICRYYETRAGFDGPQSGTYTERLARANDALLNRIPRWTEILDKLCLEFVELKRDRKNPQRMIKLQSLIEGLDSQIICARRGPAFLAALIYEYYRRGSNSVEIGTEVGLKPPAVRQLILRMKNVAAKIQNGTDVPRGKVRLCAVCGAPCIRHSKFCSKPCMKKRQIERKIIRKRMRAVPSPRFCSATCREVFKHPAPTVVSGGFGVPMEEARASGQGSGYEKYLETAERLGVKPMPFEIWSQVE